MPIQMTRAEYQAKYGSAPVLPNAKPTTAPTKMTHAEYNAKYGPKTNTLEKQPDIFSKIDTAINKPAFDVSQEKNPVKGVFKSLANSGKDLASNIYGLIKQPFQTAKEVAYDIPRTLFGAGEDKGKFATPGPKNPTGGQYPLDAKSAAVAGVKNLPELELGSFTKVLPPAVQELGGTNDNFKPQPKKALESIAEKPFTNILPLTMLKSVFEGDLTTGSGPLDKAIEKTAQAPKQIFNKVVAEPIKAVGEKVSSNFEGSGLPEKSPAEKIAIADKSIENGISKGVKPTVVGKKTLESSAKFYDSAKSAVKTISENRGKLEIVNSDGEITNKPTTNAEFAQAIDQTKSNIYKQYNDMTKAATGKEASIPMQSTMAKLQSIGQDLKYTPVERAYAQSKIPEIQELDGQSPATIEARISTYNKSLKNYYKNPTAESQVRAQIDASMAAELRRVLDQTIQQTEGEGYQDLKNQYGSLSAIEGEVNKRATVLARQNVKGLPDLTDIFTGGKLIGGVLTGNAAAVAEGGFGLALKTLYKRLNSPDRAIASMFNDVYDAYPEQPPKLPFYQPSLPPGTNTGVFGKASVNVPIEMPSRVVTNEAGETTQNLDRVGGKGSRRMTNLGDNQISAPAVKRGSYKNNQAFKARLFNKVIEDTNDILEK